MTDNVRERSDTRAPEQVLGQKCPPVGIQEAGGEVPVYGAAGAGSEEQVNDEMTVVGAVRHESDGVWIDAEFGLTDRAFGVSTKGAAPDEPRWIQLTDVRSADELIADPPTANDMMAIELGLDDGGLLAIQLPAGFAAVLVRSLEVASARGSAEPLAPTDDGATPSSWKIRSLAGVALLAVLGGMLTLADRGDADVIETAAGRKQASATRATSSTTSTSRPTTTVTTTTSPAPTTVAPSTASVPPGGQANGVPAGEPTPPPAPIAPPPITRTVTGAVEALDQVWFSDHQGPGPGTPCAGTGGYADLSPGAPVLFTDSAGGGIGAATLGAGSLVHSVKRTRAEFDQRERLIDSIYGLRIAQTNDPVVAAQLRLARAELRLHDLENIDRIDYSFEGRAFVAAYCRLPFTSPALPDLPSYGVGVTHRGIVPFSAGQLAATGWNAELAV